MKDRKYIFVTNEGHTEDPNGMPVENSQVLGYAWGEDDEDAFANLKNEYDLSGFNGDIWDFHGQGHWIVIPTNANVKSSGDAVMGRGLALQAARRFPELPRELGERIKRYGSQVFAFSQHRIFTFPTKDNYWEKANLDLIEKSAGQLARSGGIKIYLPRVGCGEGKLTWKEVKPVLRKYLDEDLFVVVHKM